MFKGIFVWIKEIISFKITKYNFNTSKYYVDTSEPFFLFNKVIFHSNKMYTERNLRLFISKKYLLETN